MRECSCDFFEFVVLKYEYVAYLCCILGFPLLKIGGIVFDLSVYIYLEYGIDKLDFLICGTLFSLFL
jgi:hypothetical protein